MTAPATARKGRRVAAPAAATDAQGRLAGKVALVTGAAGNLGGRIVRHYLAEGATVVMTGRSRERVDAARDAVLAESGVPPEQVLAVVLDGASPESVRAGITDAVAKAGRIDILVNNAGSAGPKQVLEKVPLSQAELFQMQKEGATDTETVADAMRNIFAVTWNLVRAAVPHMGEGGSVINVSTIFSRTPYYGRTAYVVPKAALNAFSRELSLELGPRGTGKSHLFQQISPYAHLVSGGKATVARMFVNMANGQRGLVC
ncbi:MAG: SDR family NAD(P)-dependent oxidoreductase, partial [Thermaurantiacus sp.]